MSFPERQIESPFHEHDRARDKLEELERRVNLQSHTINLLVECVGVLLQRQNIPPHPTLAASDKTPPVKD